MNRPQYGKSPVADAIDGVNCSTGNDSLVRARVLSPEQQARLESYEDPPPNYRSAERDWDRIERAAAGVDNDIPEEWVGLAAFCALILAIGFAVGCVGYARGWWL